MNIQELMRIQQELLDLINWKRENLGYVDERLLSQYDNVTACIDLRIKELFKDKVA